MKPVTVKPGDTVYRIYVDYGGKAHVHEAKVLHLRRDGAVQLDRRDVAWRFGVIVQAFEFSPSPDEAWASWSRHELGRAEALEAQARSIRAALKDALP